MTPSELIKGIKTSAAISGANVNTIDVETDSRKVKEGNLFVTIKGTQVDGHQYIPEAIELGATAILYEEAPQRSQPNVTYTVVKSTEDEVGRVIACFFDDPSKHLKLVGITGTNGKTAVIVLLYSLFRKLSHECGLLSTVYNFIEGQETSANRTTPDPTELNELLTKMLATGCEYVFMECSSHAVAQKRIGGLTFTGGISTNFTRGHSDYHKTFKNYRNVKKSLFDGLPESALAITGADGRNDMMMVQNTRASAKTYPIQSIADFKACIIECHFQGIYLVVDGQEVGIWLVGRFNVSNLLVVYDAVRIPGKQHEETLTAMSTLHTVDDRMDTLQSPKGFMVIVDYAHTPGALKNVLLAIHGVDRKGYIITVYDAGGNHDKGKCPFMAKQAVQLSDKIITTSDNPRFEDPRDTIDDMLAGLDVQDQKKVLTITNRKGATRTACMLVQKQGMIPVAGKEHETYQEIKGVKYHLNDKEVLRDILAQ